MKRKKDYRILLKKFYEESVQSEGMPEWEKVSTVQRRLLQKTLGFQNWTLSYQLKEAVKAIKKLVFKQLNKILK